jgi:hypothetical protein
MMNQPACLNCGKTEQQVPLIPLNFKAETKHICPQCLPVLIHKPQTLTEKLPGVEIAAPAEH